MKPIQLLKYPQDRWQLAFLPISALQFWYAAQNPKDMIVIANTPEFKRFWFLVYILPTRCYRKLLKIKHFVLRDSAQRVLA